MANSTTNIDGVSPSQLSKETTVNAAIDAASPATLFGRRASTTAALSWGFYGGTMLVSSVPTQVSNGTIALTASTTNYLYATAAGVVTKVTSAPAGWPGPLAAGATALYQVVTGAATVTSYTDYRTAGVGAAAGAGGALLIANNLSDVANAGTSRTNLGLVAIASSGSASDLSAGTVAAARMPALTGDVTTSAGAVATTIANDAVTNAKLANVATATFKGRTTAGTGDPEDLTATQATALLNNAVGDSGSGGAKGLVPAPGSGDAAAAKFLKADATWAVPAGSGGASADGSVCCGRLTLTSGDAEGNTATTTSGDVYWTPFRGAAIDLYNGSTWDRLTAQTEKTFAIGTVAKYQAFDVFGYNNSGALAIEKLEWANATVTMTIASPCVVTWTGHQFVSGSRVTFTTSGALPTGLSANVSYFVRAIAGDTITISTEPDSAIINSSGSQSGTHTGHSPQWRQTALTKQDGIYVKTGATTRRYLGTFISNSTTTSSDHYGSTSSVDGVSGKRFLFNYYNRLRKWMNVWTLTASWTYSNTPTWRVANADFLNINEWCSGGIAEDAASMSLNAAVAAGSTGAGNSQSAIGLDNLLPVLSIACTYAGTLNTQSVTDEIVTAAGAAYHYAAWLERATQSGTTTWYGSGGGSAPFHSALKVSVHI